MPSFKDINGREWTISVNGYSLGQVKKSLDVNLCDLNSGILDRLASDPVLLVDVLYVLCRNQCEVANITDRQFGESLVGDPIEAAAKALVEAIADFFPKERRDLFKDLIKKTADVDAKLLADARTILDDPKTTEALEQAFRKRMKSQLDEAEATAISEG